MGRWCVIKADLSPCEQTNGCIIIQGWGPLPAMNLFINPLQKLYIYIYHYLPYPYPLVIGVNYKPTPSSRGPDLKHIPGNSNSKPCSTRMRNSSDAFFSKRHRLSHVTVRKQLFFVVVVLRGATSSFVQVLVSSSAVALWVTRMQLFGWQCSGKLGFVSWMNLSQTLGNAFSIQCNVWM